MQREGFAPLLLQMKFFTSIRRVGTAFGNCFSGKTRTDVEESRAAGGKATKPLIKKAIVIVP
jgi:hypothetical protein